MFANIKLVLCGGIVALFLIGGVVIAIQHHEVKTLNASNATANGTIAAQAASVSDAHASVLAAASSAAITDNTQLQAIKDTATVNTVTAGINTAQETQEQKIHDAYSLLPKTTQYSKKGKVATAATPASEPVMSEADALSQVRIESLWQTYCQLNPSADAALCAANQ